MLFLISYVNFYLRCVRVNAPMAPPSPLVFLQIRALNGSFHNGKPRVDAEGERVPAAARSLFHPVPCVAPLSRPAHSIQFGAALSEGACCLSDSSLQCHKAKNCLPRFLPARRIRRVNRLHILIGRHRVEKWAPPRPPRPKETDATSNQNFFYKK